TPPPTGLNMAKPLPIARFDDVTLTLLPALANRHGLITGATGTGKTVTLQVLAEQLASVGVPVFMADGTGDLSGLGAAGAGGGKFQKRLDKLGMTDGTAKGNSLVVWDGFGHGGHPVRAA